MFRKVTNLLCISLLSLTACTSGTEENELIVDPATNDGGSTAKVDLVVSRAAIDDFNQAGVDRFTLLIYKAERKGTSLFAEKEIEVAAGNTVSMELALGENFSAIAVANAQLSEKNSLETLTLTLDPASDKAVWVSSAVKFASDKSVSSVSLLFQRAVARVEFAPAETEAELAAQTSFDALELKFSNVATQYVVSEGRAIGTDYTVTTKADRAYTAGFYTFETSALDDECLLDINYIKGGQVVNTSAGSLETGVRFAANNLYRMTVPVLNPGFTATPLSTGAARIMQAITVTKTSL